MISRLHPPRRAGESLVPTLIATILVGCAETPEAAPPPPSTVRDSAGVAIIESGRETIDRLPEWRVGEPTLTLGSAQGDPAHQFSEVVGAVALSGGRTLVGDAESRELRLFDATGRGVLTFAGRGEGPGELPWLNSFTVQAADTVAVSAWPFGYVSRFDPAGEYVDSYRIGPFWPRATTEILQDGSLLLDYFDGGHGNNIELWAANGEGNTFRPEGALVRAHLEGPMDTLRPVVGEEWFKRGTWRVDLWLSPTPFSSGPITAVAEPRVFVGETGLPEIEVRGLDGTLERLIRWDAEQVAVSGRDRELHAEGLRETLRQPARAAHLERWIADAPYPEYKPAFIALEADRAGRVWVGLPGAPDADDDWLVFDADGKALASVTLPSGGQPLDIGDDYVLLLLSDELDVERIERRPLVALITNRK